MARRASPALLAEIPKHALEQGGEVGALGCPASFRAAVSAARLASSCSRSSAPSPPSAAAAITMVSSTASEPRSVERTEPRPWGRTSWRFAYTGTEPSPRPAGCPAATFRNRRPSSCATAAVRGGVDVRWARMVLLHRSWVMGRGSLGAGCTPARDAVPQVVPASPLDGAAGAADPDAARPPSDATGAAKAAGGT